MRKYLIGIALAGAAAMPACAQEQGGAPPPPPPGPQAPLTRDAVQAMVRAHFEHADANHDGKVTLKEAEAARGAMRRGPGGRPPAGQDGPPPGAPGGPGGPAGMDTGGPPPPPPGMAAGRGMGPGMGMFGMLNGRTFERIDANHDGKVTAPEAEAGALRMFDAADTDHDGTISPDEHQAVRERMMAQRRQREE